mmetsp:Transcript_24844/g.41402  ORF Transcript_24844/g.41402 Transcript_24844/m.41402 type:complete len:642 (+) Transcript_24844:209-2134(+)|eukprot:CAMPEP_0174990284 /NCGR_PEP_ID=MMETSP0004_2-20121128/21229_1 /TAXON_ID=420556 /ORGANISM="Ochromonas sp., Strain CCMP1393" /LENGTH=641 /DNA_ID=CAMNT_0016243861 /DNA_START=140 /DNA_END=2065 /DNA_ORIENTATION=-
MSGADAKSYSVEDFVSTSVSEKAKVFIMSWNMGNAEAEGLENVFTEQNIVGQYEIIVLGLQESTYSMKNNGDCIAHLQSMVKGIMGGNYFQVMHAHRAQMQLYVFAMKSLQRRITNVQKSVENTGFLHVFPNKGGILVTMEVDGTKLAFISCHLTAHEGVKHCEERNASIYEIFGGVRAGDERFDVSVQFHHLFWMGDMNYRTTYDTVNIPTNTKKNLKDLQDKSEMIRQGSLAADTSKKSDGSAVSDKSLAGAKGDSDDDVSDDEAGTEKSKKKKEWLENKKKTMDMIVNERWESILALDELNREIKAGRVLDEFVALQPSFPPTFKRQRHKNIVPKANPASRAQLWELMPEDTPGMDNAVQNYYHPKRMPSFTDRILYKSMPAFNGNVQNLFFESCELAVSSDHKPVRAGFSIALTKGEAGIMIDKQLLRWKGKVSSATSGNRSDVQMMKLRLSELKGENLEEMDAAMFGGGSDPYIVITTDPPSALLYKGTLSKHFEGIKSKVIKHNLNPVWKEDMELSLASVDLKGLSRNVSLILSVWDEDYSNADDLIGVMSIPLKEVIHSHTQGSPFYFKQQLHSNTEIMGQLSGKIAVEGDFQELLNAYEALEQQRDDHDVYFSLAEAITLAPDAAGGCGCTIA